MLPLFKPSQRFYMGWIVKTCNQTWNISSSLELMSNITVCRFQDFMTLSKKHFAEEEKKLQVHLYVDF